MKIANDEIAKALRLGLEKHENYLTARMMCHMNDLANMIESKLGHHELFDILARVTIDIYRDLAPIIGDLLAHQPDGELDFATIPETGTVLKDVLDHMKLEPRLGSAELLKSKVVNICQERH